MNTRQSKLRGLAQRIEFLERTIATESDAEILQWGERLSVSELREHLAYMESEAAKLKAEGLEDSSEPRHYSQPAFQMSNAELLRAIKPGIEQWRAIRQAGANE